MESRPNKRILVVEDDPLVTEVVVDALDGLYDTSHAENSAAAMRYLQAGGIDAMLLDCTLPGGLDPHLVPMADDSGVPVILMSGHPDMQDRVPGVPRPCIQKPFSLNALLSTIESVMPGEGVTQAESGARPSGDGPPPPASGRGRALPEIPRVRGAAPCRSGTTL